MTAQEFAEKYVGRKVKIKKEKNHFYIGDRAGGIVAGYSSGFTAGPNYVLVKTTKLNEPYHFNNFGGIANSVAGWVVLREITDGYCYFRAEELELVDEVKPIDTSKYPHKCPRCSSPCYIGFIAIDCSVCK